MYINAHELETPFKTFVGNAAWTIMHTAPYQAESYHAEHETVDVAEFARKYSGMVSNMVAVYPCRECREHAAKSKDIQSAIEAIAAYAETVQVDAPPASVADDLAILAFELHNTVNMRRDGTNTYGITDDRANETHTTLLQLEHDTMVGFMRRMQRNRLPRSYVANLLRIRWRPS